MVEFWMVGDGSGIQCFLLIVLVDGCYGLNWLVVMMVFWYCVWMIFFILVFRGGVVCVCCYLYCVLLLLVYIIVFLLFILIGMFWLWGELCVGEVILGVKVVNWWQGGLMWIFGFCLVQIGMLLFGVVLFVVNYVSWVDICILYSQCMMGFVVKCEIVSWLLVGWLVVCGQIIFYQCGNIELFGGVMQVMVDCLCEGKVVGVFLEGCIRGGYEVGLFYVCIFQVVVEIGVLVQLVVLVYGFKGDVQIIVVFGFGESFFVNFLCLFGELVWCVEVYFLVLIGVQDLEGCWCIVEMLCVCIVVVMSIG